MFIQPAQPARATGATGLHHLADATLLLDAAGRVLQANEAATALLREGEALAVVNGALKAHHKAEQPLLRRLLARASGGVDGFFTLRRPAGAVPVQVILLGLADARVMVRLLPARHRAGPPEAAMRLHFGLTAREAELAVRFAEGATLAEAAGLMGLAPPLAQALAARVLERTGAASTAEVGRLLDTIL